MPPRYKDCNELINNTKNDLTSNRNHNGKIQNQTLRCGVHFVIFTRQQMNTDLTSNSAFSAYSTDQNMQSTKVNRNISQKIQNRKIS